MSDRNRGGRIAPDGRGPQPKGVGRNAKRHDLERPATPGLANSDLSQGDVSDLEEGQRIAPIQNQSRGQSPPLDRGASTTSSAQNRDGTVVPDAIQFLGDQQGSSFNLPVAEVGLDHTKIETWGPILRQLVSGPGSTGTLASALINQARSLRQTRTGPAIVIDLQATDDAIEAMLAEGV